MTQTATTLAHDATADAETIDVVAPLSDALVDGYFVQIDSEILEVQYRGMGTDPGVRRGSLGTARAAHSADDDVTPVTVVVQTDAPTAPPPATAGGAAQTVSLLGPYRVAFDTDGVAGTGGAAKSLADGGYVQLDLLPDGAILVASWAEVVTPFNGGGDIVTIDFQPDGDPDNSSDIGGPFSLTYQDTTAPSVFVVAKTMKAPAFSLPGNQKIGHALTGCALMVYGTFNAPPTAGEADVYALIATPA